MSKQTNGVKGKIKSLFGRKTTGINSNSTDQKEGIEFIFPKEVLKEISQENSLLHRVRALKELCEIVECKEIEDHAIEALWKTIEDLLQPTVATEGRQAALAFIIALTTGQYKHLGILRSQLFHFIVNHRIDEDLQYRVTLLKVLTDNGKDIQYLEQIGLFLVNLMSEALNAVDSGEFLQFVINIVHYNSSFLDKEIICSIVGKTCDYCNNARDENEVENCLQLLDATVKYGNLSSEGLFPLIVTLCRTVNIEKFCQPSWKLMRNLVGTKLGHTAVYMMCQILEDNQNILDIILLRGAVFFIGMCIWGSKRVTSLRYSPLHVLSSFKICLQSNDAFVAQEISLSLQRLVKKFGEDQGIVTWDIILDILEILLKLIERSNAAETQSLSANVHALLTNVEQLHSEQKFCGSTRRFFGIVETCANQRPEYSIITLLTYYEEQINPSNDDWLEIFRSVLNKYFKNEYNTLIRVKVLNMITSIFSSYKHKYEDEILELVLNDYLSNIASIKDKEVRMVVSQLLSDILQMCSCSKYADVLAVIETLLSSVSLPPNDKNLQDIEIAIDALIKAFREKLFEPSNNYVVNVFNILVNHINDHYNCNLSSSVAGGIIRKRIFNLLLSVRVNTHHFIGIIDSDERVKYSVHAIFKPMHLDLSGFGKTWLTDFDFEKSFDAILKCLKNELDWVVLEYVLKHLTQQLHNKSLFIYCQCNMNKFCSALCILINDKMYLNKVQNCPPNMGISDLRNIIFPILSVLAAYHSYLSRERQFELVKCLEFGLNTYCAHTCVSCLTICTLEMQHVMIRTLPSILVKLSQISSTVLMSIPVLEFLSTLKEISTLYTNFKEEQYMSIFAMALSYTDSYKYSYYTVTLAHQVIADWFTRCRLPFRKGFVTLIAKALKSSSVMNPDKKYEDEEKIRHFHTDMTDVCLDMMARYSFSLYSVQPKRTPVIDFLLSKGTSQTWILGNMLITITTSYGLRDNCLFCSSTDLKSSVEEAKTVMEKDPSSRKHIDNKIKLESKKGDSKCTVVTGDKSSDYTSRHYTAEKQEGVKPIDIVTAIDCEVTNGDIENSCEEEGREIDPTPLVEQLVFSNTHAFSPSEQLLFSRQASKAHVSDNYDDEYDSSEEDSDFDLQFDETENVNSLKQVEKTNNDSTSVYSEVVNEPAILSAQDTNDELFDLSKNKISKPLVKCECVCEGWAEVHIRRPTGNISWVMRIENNEEVKNYPLSQLSLLASSLEGNTINNTLDSFLSPLLNNAQPAVRQMDALDVRSARSSSDSSCKSSSSSLQTNHRRRFSTGSIDTSSLKAFQPNPLMDNGQGETLNTKIKKFPLKKSLSSPRSSTNYQHFDATEKQHDKISVKQQETTKFGRPWSSTAAARSSISSEGEKTYQNSCTPSFIFLQLFYSPVASFHGNDPLCLEQSEVIERAVKILDRIPSFNTHKFGVIYVGNEQEKSETEILGNEFGSARYTDFLSELGDLVKLTECSQDIFTGGMERTGADGKFAYFWKDATTQVIFHVATLMPNKETDRKFVSKKLHIGNNFVTIVYDDSKHGYKFGTLKGQFNLAEILIRPLEYNSNMVKIRVKDKSDGGVLDTQPHVISDCNLAVLVRQLAIHTNMATVTEQNEKKTTNAFASNWLERLRQIHRIKSKAMSLEVPVEEHPLGYDFTAYT